MTERPARRNSSWKNPFVRLDQPRSGTRPADERPASLLSADEKRARDAGIANAKAIAAADFLGAHGHPCRDISAGGTGTYYIAGANPRITEVQAGSYTLLDSFHGNLVPGGFEVAMTVLGTVISRRGHTVVLDCGRKVVGIDFVTPPLVAYPEAEIRYYAEEHCLADFPGEPPLDLGDTAEVMGGYGPTDRQPP